MNKDYDRTAENLNASNGFKGESAAMILSQLDPEETKRIRAACESAYRRGYSQGYFAAMGTTINNVFFNKIMRWRYKYHGGNVELPPERK